MGIEAKSEVPLPIFYRGQKVHDEGFRAKKPLGLLINFNETLLKDGITRIINTPSSDD